MPKHALLTLLLGVAAIGGCATPAPQAGAGPKEEGEYITGSRLPRKTVGDQPVASVSNQEYRQTKQEVIGNLPKGN